MKIEYSRHIFEKNSQMSNFMKIVQWKPNFSIWVDRRKWEAN